MAEHEDTLSRRTLFRVSALATTAAAAAACSPVPYADAGPMDTPGTDATSSDAGSSLDAMIMNGMLAAEYTHIKAYDAAADILAAPSASDPLVALAPTVLQIARHFQSQHREHSAALVAAITEAGGTPILDTSVQFVPPAGFTGTVTNILKLACNGEKSAAHSYNRLVGALSSAGRRFLAANIQGDETQHFIVYYVILKGTAAPGSAIGSMIDQIVPATFVSTMGTMTGLQAVPDFTYG